MFKRMRHVSIIALQIACLLVILILTACGSTVPSTPSVTQPKESVSAPIQSNSGGAVTVEAKLLGHQNSTLVFEISMDTHSVNLDTYDLKQLAILRDGKGEYKPEIWDAPPGGHHRKGKLVFAHADKSARTFELVIRNVAGVSERVLIWQVQPE